VNTDAWSILIYACPDPESQVVLSTHLRPLRQLIVETTEADGDFFVIIETYGESAALKVHELVMALDSDAELVGTHRGSRSKGRLTLLDPLEGTASEAGLKPIA